MVVFIYEISEKGLAGKYVWGPPCEFVYKIGTRSQKRRWKQQQHFIWRWFVIVWHPKAKDSVEEKMKFWEVGGKGEGEIMIF